MGKKKRARAESAAEAHRPAPGLPVHADRRMLFLASLGLWCLLLWVFQFNTLAKFSEVLPVNAFFGTFAGFSPYLSDLRSPIRLDGLDKFLIFLLAAIPIHLIYLQTRFQALKGAWEWVGANVWRKSFFLILFFGSLCRFAVHPGDFPYIGDGAPFLAGADEFWHALKLGSFANYSTLFYSGWNCRQYMGNLFSVLAGTCAFLTDSHDGVKLLLLATHALSGIGMFLWIEKLTRNRYAALFAAVAFCLNYWHFHQVFILGRLHLCIVYACIPWAFYFAERGLADARHRLRNFLCIALPLAGTVYVHFVWGCMLWGLLIAYSVFGIAARLKKPERAAALFAFAVAVAFQALITIGLITAPFVQKKESMASYSTAAFGPDTSNPSSGIELNVLYQWYNGHWSLGERPPESWYNSYLGLVPLLFALLALIGLSRKQGMDRKALGWIAFFLLGNFILVFCYAPVTGLPGLSLFRVFTTERYQTFLIFFMAACSAFGVLVWLRWINARFTGWRKNFLLALPLLLIAVDVGSTSFQIPFGKGSPWNADSRFYDRYSAESEAYSQKNEVVPYYFFLEGASGYDYHLRGPSLKVSLLDMPSDQGIQPETGPLKAKFGDTFYDWLTLRLKQPGVFPDTFSFDYFYVNNFRDIMVFQNPARGYDLGLLQDLETDQNFVHAQLRYHTPVIAAKNVEPYRWNSVDSASELRQLLANMQLDYANRTAGKIFVRPGKTPDALPLDSTKLALDLLDYKVYAKKYFYRVRLNQPAYVRLAASYYGFLDVRLDGKTTPFYPGAIYEVVMEVPAGEHVIEVSGGWDPYRKTWLWISWLAIAALIFVAVRYPAGWGKRPIAPDSTD